MPNRETALEMWLVRVGSAACGNGLGEFRGVWRGSLGRLGGCGPRLVRSFDWSSEDNHVDRTSVEEEIRVTLWPWTSLHSVRS